MWTATCLITFKHLFKHTIHNGLPKSKKALVAEYMKTAGFYSYDAASEDEDQVSHWIGREVKRFLAQAVTFTCSFFSTSLRRRWIAGWRNSKGQQTLDSDSDDEYAVTEEDIAAEQKEESLMLLNATRWDNFLGYVELDTRPWPQGEADSDDYRKGRAVDSFNSFMYVSNYLLQLSPEHLTRRYPDSLWGAQMS